MKRFLPIMSATLFVLAPLDAKTGDKNDTPPNVVVILIDTLRPDYLGFTKHAKETAPFLGKLAKRSCVFENAISTSSWTAPSTASLFTGLYPPQHTVIQGFKAHRGMVEELKQKGEAALALNQIPTNIQTLPQLFKTAGYSTFGLVANINIGREIGFNRGFDRFEKHVRADARILYRKVKNWQRDLDAEQPFFLYLHFNDVHYPYRKHTDFYTPPENAEDENEALYKSEIGFLDAFLRKLWKLDTISENTLLVVLSDHGEEFRDHGATKHGPTLYRELNNIFFMVHGPSLGVEAKRYKQNVSLVDVMPTLAGFIEHDMREAGEGVSLLPILNGSENENTARRLKDRCLFAHRMYSFRYGRAVWSVKCGHLKLIDWYGKRQKLFDHNADPKERRNLSNKKPESAKELANRLQAFKERMQQSKRTQPIQSKEIELDDALLQRLRALGYAE